MAKLTWSSLFLFSAVFVTGTIGGYPNFLCPTDNDSTVYVPCDADCKHQHGVKYGTCGRPFFKRVYKNEDSLNCYCGPLDGEIRKESLQCMKKTQNFQDLCKTDCQCSHAALDGICHWDTKSCECIGNDQSSSLCNYATPQEFAQYIAKTVGTEGKLGEFEKPHLPPYMMYSEIS